MCYFDQWGDSLAQLIRTVCVGQYIGCLSSTNQEASWLDPLGDSLCWTNGGLPSGHILFSDFDLELSGVWAEILALKVNVETAGWGGVVVMGKSQFNFDPYRIIMLFVQKWLRMSLWMFPATPINDKNLETNWLPHFILGIELNTDSCSNQRL